MKMQVLSLASLSGLRIWLCCELWYIGHRPGSDLVLLWLWHNPAAAAPIHPLAWEHLYAVVVVALKRPKKKKKKERERKREWSQLWERSKKSGETDIWAFSWCNSSKYHPKGAPGAWQNKYCLWFFLKPRRLIFFPLHLKKSWFTHKAFDWNQYICISYTYSIFSIGR